MEVVGPGVCGDVEQDWQGVGREAGVRVVLWLAWTEWGVAVWSEVPSVCDGVWQCDEERMDHPDQNRCSICDEE